MSLNEQTLGALFAEYEKNAAITVLEPGVHRLEVASATVKGKGITPVYKVVEGPDTGKRAMAGTISPGDTEGGRHAFFRKLEKFGLDKNFFSSASSLEDVAKALVGRVVDVELGVKEWQGEPRNELSFNIKLVTAPPLPAFGGVPQVAATATATASAPAPTPQATPVVEAAPPVATIPTVAPPPADGDPGF